MDVKAIRDVANAVLYEGYMLYPYRPSALKNRSQGWTFGTLLPQAYAESHPGEPSGFQAEVIVTGAAPQLFVEARFLQFCRAEARERSVCVAPVSLSDMVAGAVHVPFAFPEASEVGIGCYSLQGNLRVAAERAGDRIFKITIGLDNESPPALRWNTRDQALQQALVSAHALLTVGGGEFVSLLSPPDELRALTESCKQAGVFPVLAGDEGERTAMLVSPIILYDYPQIARSSYGDFFDSAEIDEMLTLRVLTLTDVEKEEVRAAGERSRALLDRTESLTPEEILRLHGLARRGKE